MVGEVMKHGVRGHEVERAVGERKRLRDALVEADVPGADVDLVEHRLRRIDAVDLVEGIREQPDHEPGPASDVEHSSRPRPLDDAKEVGANLGLVLRAEVRLVPLVGVGHPGVDADVVAHDVGGPGRPRMGMRRGSIPVSA